MVKKVGITGGIGSGKSYICKQISEQFGILVYYSDLRCRTLMNKNLNLIQTIINEFGEDSYINGDLNREKFINLLFSDDTSRMKMNSIVHPFMKTDFNEWCEIWKNEDYILFESAILFDTEDKMEMDFNILVVADMDIRIERVQKRNSFTVENVMERINSQSSDEFKTQFADCVITNNDKEETTKQIIEVHKIIMSL